MLGVSMSNFVEPGGSTGKQHNHLKIPSTARGTIWAVFQGGAGSSGSFSIMGCCSGSCLGHPENRQENVEFEAPKVWYYYIINTPRVNMV